MNSKVLKTLEYDKILQQLENHAYSGGGKALCRSLAPSKEGEAVRTMQAETAAALSRLLKRGRLSFSSAYDMSAALKRTELGSSLSISELLMTAALLENATAVKNYGKRDRNHVEDDCLDPIFDMLMTADDVCSHIRRCIIDENELSDAASPDLSKIRRSIKVTEDKIRSQLGSMLNGPSRTYLQDSVITMRNGRYCVPVKAEYRSNVPGMIHDQSSSGSTVFIEPMAVVKLNNDIRRLEKEEEKEIDRILAALSQEVYENKETIETDSRLLIRLDFIFSRASYALEMDAGEPLIDESGHTALKKARHPLLEKDAAVPIDIRIGEDFDMLVITGPNTGGKTVALKTIGLLTLMAQSGLHIPAASGSRIAIFDEVYADIGDEQSIEQSLSTFSSHMKNVISILKKANQNSLVLFDELGAGTDPVEGAALAQAVLEHLHKMHIRTIATTHYSELKLYALSESGVENASCEFDVQTLRPTYKLLIGIPGKSNAFAISKKLGLPDYIIDAARRLIDEQNESFEDIISELEKTRAGLEKERSEADRLKAEAAAIKAELENKNRDFSEKKSDKLQKANEEAYAVLKEAKDYADSVMRLFQKTAAAPPNIKKLEQTRAELRKRLDKTASDMNVPSEKKRPKKELKPSDLSIGEAVKVLSMNLDGTVLTRPDSKGYVLVQMGIMRSKIHISELELIDEKSAEKKNVSGSAGSLKFSKSLSVSPEINLIGKTVDEAIAELDKYLDDAYMAHLPEVRIVHGKGTGALRKGIQSYLKGLSIVKEFGHAAYGEGDSGVTVVKFKN